MIRRSLNTLAIGLLLVTSCFAQARDAVRCAVTVYRLNRAKDGRLIKSVEFSPKIAEEELTNKPLRLPGSRLFVIASVFPTDESMVSGKGRDSIRLGLAVTPRKWPQAFDAPNNAVAETPLSEAFDTARVETNAYAGHKRFIVRLECWDPRREKQK